MAVAGQVIVRILGENSSAVRSIKEVNRELESSRRAFERDFGEVAKMAQRGAFAVGAAVAAMGVSVGVLVSKANDAFDALDASERRMASTAKAVGADLTFLQRTSADIAETFGLSARQANDFTSEVARLTAKAGDLAQTGNAIRNFLDLGASRGYNAQQTLEAVRQAILGIDEGTDKLFGVNPSVLYQRYADAVGKSVGKLGDHEKALAIVVAAEEDARRVRGAGIAFLDTAAGKQARLNAELEDAAAAFGRAYAPARIRVLSGLAEVVSDLSQKIEENRDNIEDLADAFVNAASKAANFALKLLDVAAAATRSIPENVQRWMDQRAVEASIRAVDPEGIGFRPLKYRQAENEAFIREQLAQGGLVNMLGQRIGPDGKPVNPAAAAAASAVRELTEEEKKALDEHIKALQDAVRISRALSEEAIRAATTLTPEMIGLPRPDPRADLLRRVAEAGADPFGVGTATGRIASFFATGRLPTPPGYQSVEDMLRAGREAAVQEARAFLPVDRLDELFFAPVEEGVEGLADAGATAVATFGAMAEAAIVGSDQMASAVIHGFSRILQSLPGIGGLGGAVIGALGGIVGAIFNRSKSDPLPVRVEDYGERAKTEHRQTRQGPDRVTIRFIDPRTGGQVDEVEYVLGRRERVDGVPRFSDLGV